MRVPSVTVCRMPMRDVRVAVRMTAEQMHVAQQTHHKQAAEADAKTENVETHLGPDKMDPQPSFYNISLGARRVRDAAMHLLSRPAAASSRSAMHPPG